MELTPFIENAYRLINKTFYLFLQILLLSQEKLIFPKVFLRAVLTSLFLKLYISGFSMGTTMV